MSAFTNFSARVGFVQAVCAVAEGAEEPAPPARVVTEPRAVVHAVLHDAQRRVAALGSRAGMPRSLASVTAAHTVLFLGSTFRGCETRTIAAPNLPSRGDVFAVSRDGRTAIIMDEYRGRIYAICPHTGAVLRGIGGFGSGRLQFKEPRQVFVASDDIVFVADTDNNRVQILTLQLDFHSEIGRPRAPTAVCADDHVIVVCDGTSMSVLERGSQRLLRDIALPADLRFPSGLCFMCGNRAVAVANHDVCASVFVLSLDGSCVRRVGAGLLFFPGSVACSGYDDLIVAETHSRHVRVFDSSGELRKKVACPCEFVVCIHVHNSELFAQCCFYPKCIVFS